MSACPLPIHAMLTAVLCLAASLAGAPASADPQWRWSGVERVVAFGDVHGAYRELVALLQRADVIDESLHWTGGETHLVSLGDLVDRGPDSRAVLDLLMRLEDEAARSGGFVHVVLGNHEVMNLIGDHRYVSAAEYAAFADVSSVDADGRTGHRQAFSASGRYGAWLLGKPVLIAIDDTAYVHGGLPAAFAALGLALGNARFDDALTQALAPGTEPDPLVADNGPVWYRGSALCHVLIEGDRLQRSLDRLGVRRVVIGHTPTRGRRVVSRFGGSVVMLDTGMLAAVYRGRASALVVNSRADSVIVADEDAPRGVDADPGAYSGEWATSDRLAALLESAPISDSTPSSDRAYDARNVTLAGPNGVVAARFTPLSKDRLRHEVAAYRLDRLIGLGMIAPAVAREVDGKQGLLTAPGAWISERQRVEKGVARSNPCEVGSDYALAVAFDALIGNRARSVDNLGYDQPRDELRLFDLANAFATSGLPRDTMLQQPKLPPALRDRLMALDERTLVGAVGDRLQAREIKALLARRDAIVRWPVLE